MPDNKPTAEAAFRDNLQDVLAIMEKLSVVCQTVEETIGMIRLAIENDGQLRLLMAMFAKK